jgi:hypothetical protein
MKEQMNRAFVLDETEAHVVLCALAALEVLDTRTAGPELAPDGVAIGLKNELTRALGAEAGETAMLSARDRLRGRPRKAEAPQRGDRRARDCAHCAASLDCTQRPKADAVVSSTPC